MSVYKDKDVGDCFGEGEYGGEESPGMRICVENDDQECRCWAYSMLRFALGKSGGSHLQLLFHNDLIHLQRS